MTSMNGSKIFLKKPSRASLTNHLFIAVQSVIEGRWLNVNRRLNNERSPTKHSANADWSSFNLKSVVVINYFACFWLLSLDDNVDCRLAT